MNIQRLYPLLFVLVLPATLAADDLGPYKQATASYWIYGGGLGDPVTATSKDKKIAFSIEGDAAKQIFEAIGPDKKDVCSEGGDTRFRSRDNENLTCTRSKENIYTCSFGFDLVSGKSIGGSIC